MKFKGLITASLIFACFQAAAKNPPYPRGAVDELFPNGPKPVEHSYQIDDREIHYWQVAGGPARIVFLHGTPGDWKAWAHYLADPELQKRATLIAVDRPGFGASNPGKTAPQLGEQARLLAPLLDGPGAPTIIVGHSLGGPIGAELAMRYPQLVRGAVLVAPSIDPNTEQPRWYNVAMTFWLVKAIAPNEFAWSNEELLVLVDELNKQTPRWSSLKMPITVVQGAKDELVDPRTAAYAEKVLPKPNGKVVVVPDQGHFVLWNRPDLVTKEIIDVLDRTAAK
ncbi:alpha/beta hydrolase [Nevskia sp.]|jgi:uncharacterized protein|uniref:alpha/beta fold hydrolase n=1 Tax=Nevskia sp. TaxID=1929292 RepID=UPI0025CDE09F|nr:alpha/beta hydrolase [Nevskia sp.]